MPTLADYTPVADSSLLPFGGTMIPQGHENISDVFDISSIFENGFQFGTVNSTGLQIGTAGRVIFNHATATGIHPGIAPFSADLSTYLPSVPNAGVFFDTNTARDSVVITWNAVPGYITGHP